MHIKTTNFWLSWIFASLLVYPLVAILGIAFSMFWFPLIEVLSPSSNFDYGNQVYNEIYTFLSVVGIGGVVALSVGLLQRTVIKRYFHFTPQYWRRATVVGGLIAAPVTVFVMISLHDYMSANYWQLLESGQFDMLSTLINVLPMVLYVTIMSAVQMIVLRQYVRNAWLWIVANAVAGLMFSMLVTVTFNPGFIDWLLAAIAQGAITGFAMLWLLHRLHKDEQAGDEPDFAYQHVPIDIDDE